MKNVFDGYSSRLDTDEERISELEDISIEKPKLKSKKTSWRKTSKNYGTASKVVT